VCLGGDDGWWAGGHAVAVARDGVFGERVGDQIEELSAGSDAAGSPQVEVVVDDL
jgi:hypothetical protein